MVYTKGEWKLYCKEVRFKAGNKPGKPRNIYFFSKRTPKKGTPCDMPDGYEVGINSVTKMPFLKYSGNRKSTWKKLHKERHTS